MKCIYCGTSTDLSTKVLDGLVEKYVGGKTMEDTCGTCEFFTLDNIPEQIYRPAFFKTKGQGLCHGCPATPEHIEHRTNMRCFWFAAKEEAEC